MTELAHVQSFRDLVVYRRVRAVSRRIFDLSKTFPAEEAYSLTSQIRRASRSIGAQIAEAWAKRRYEKHFVSKLTDADAEQQETVHWVDTALDCDYVEEKEAVRMISELSEIGCMLNSMMQKASLSCGSGAWHVREDTATYFACDPDDTDVDSDNR